MWRKLLGLMLGLLVLSMTVGTVSALQEEKTTLPKGATMIGRDLIVGKDRVPNKELFLKQLDAIRKYQRIKKTPIEPLGYHKEASASGYDSDTIFGSILYLKSYLDVSWNKNHWWEKWRITVDPSPYAAHTAWLGSDPFYADSISLTSTVIFHGWVGSITVSADGPSWTLSPDKREVTFSASDKHIWFIEMDYHAYATSDAERVGQDNIAQYQFRKDGGVYAKGLNTDIECHT